MPSATTGTTRTAGLLDEPDALTLRCELGDGAVVFGDGIEADALRVGWGQRIRVAAAAEKLALVR